MEIQEILGYMLNTTARLIKRDMDRKLEQYHITTSQWAVLKLLDSKGKLSQTQIAFELLSDKATVGDVILRLCEKGHLVKSMDTKDRRAFTVSLSPDSMKMVKEIEEIAASITAKALMGMEQKEIEIFYKVLKQIMINLS